MPTYTYHCEHCGHQFDKRQSFSESALVVCPQCHKHRLHKVYQPAGVVFKGSGFYITDKRGKSSVAKPSLKGKSGDKTESKAGAKPEAKKAESKSKAAAKDD